MTVQSRILSLFYKVYFWSQVYSNGNIKKSKVNILLYSDKRISMDMSVICIYSKAKKILYNWTQRNISSPWYFLILVLACKNLNKILPFC